MGSIGEVSGSNRAALRRMEQAGSWEKIPANSMFCWLTK